MIELTSWVAEVNLWVTALAASWWVYPALFLLSLGDAFLVVIPSEVAVASLASLAVTTGSPPLWAIIPVAAVGAVVGDIACYWVGRSVGLERWRWQREGRLGLAVESLRELVLRRPATIILVARYIPFARIAVNLTVGAARLPLGRFLPLSLVAAFAWAGYHSTIGTILGSVLRDQPLLALVVTVAAALLVGVLIDRAIAAGALIRRLAARWTNARHGEGPVGPGPESTTAE